MTPTNLNEEDPSPHSSNELERVNFTLDLGRAYMEASVEVPVGTVTLTELLPVLQNLSSHVIEKTVDLVKASGADISCRAGCGACCRQMVPLSFFEAEALYQWITTLPPESQQKLERRFQTAIEQLQQRGALEHITSALWTGSLQERHALALGYFSAGVPCPFLEDESCGIHPIRPIVCREYLVTSPAVFCSNPTPETVDCVEIPVHFSTALVKLGAKLEESGRGWIPLVFLVNFMKAGAKPGSGVTGVGHDVLYQFITQIAAPKKQPEAPPQPAA